MTSNELYEQINEFYLDFKENDEKFVNKGTKTASVRARKAIGELKKLVTAYRKASVEESKKS